MRIRWSWVIACCSVMLTAWLLLRAYPVSLGNSKPNLTNLPLPQIPATDGENQQTPRYKIDWGFWMVDLDAMREAIHLHPAFHMNPWPRVFGGDDQVVLLDDAQALLLTRASLAITDSMIFTQRCQVSENQQSWLRTGQTAEIYRGYFGCALPEDFNPRALLSALEGTWQSGILLTFQVNRRSDSLLTLQLNAQLAVAQSRMELPYPDAPPGSDFDIQLFQVTPQHLERSIEVPPARTALFIVPPEKGLNREWTLLSVKVTPIPDQ